MTIFDAAMEYKKDSIPTIIIAGKNMEVDPLEIGLLKVQSFKG